MAGQQDSDHDGLSDALEQKLLSQFMPKFMIGSNDCSVRPAAFEPGVEVPSVRSEDGTLYGQAFLPGQRAMRGRWPSCITTICGERTVEATVMHWTRSTCRFLFVRPKLVFPWPRGRPCTGMLLRTRIRSVM